MTKDKPLSSKAIDGKKYNLDVITFVRSEFVEAVEKLKEEVNERVLSYGEIVDKIDKIFGSFDNLPKEWEKVKTNPKKYAASHHFAEDTSQICECGHAKEEHAIKSNLLGTKEGSSYCCHTKDGNPENRNCPCKKFTPQEKTYNEVAHDVLEEELNQSFKKPKKKGCGEFDFIDGVVSILNGLLKRSYSFMSAIHEINELHKKTCPKCEVDKPIKKYAASKQIRREIVEELEKEAKEDES